MTSEPVAGFPSKKAVILAFLEQGLGDAEIMRRTGSTLAAIAVYRTQRNRRGALTLAQRDKAIRIYTKALDVMAEAIGCSPYMLHGVLKRVHIPSPTGSSALRAPSDSDDDPADGEEESTSITPSPSPVPKPEEQKPVLVAKRNPVEAAPTTGQVYLKNRSTGAYLHQSCELMTMEKAYRWKGTPTQALACKRQFPEIAGALSMVRAEMIVPKPVGVPQ